jgi:hypothetical protein
MWRGVTTTDVAALAEEEDRLVRIGHVQNADEAALGPARRGRDRRERVPREGNSAERNMVGLSVRKQSAPSRPAVARWRGSATHAEIGPQCVSWMFNQRMEFAEGAKKRTYVPGSIISKTGRWTVSRKDVIRLRHRIDVHQ